MINQDAIKDELLDFHNHKGDYAELAVNTDPVLIQKKTALLWKNIIKKGFVGISPSSSSVSSAADSLYSSLNSKDAGTAIYAFYASAMSSIGNGMSGYSTLTPPIPLLLSAPFENKNLACETLASQLVACAKTGMSMLIAPPNTVEGWS